MLMKTSRGIGVFSVELLNDLGGVLQGGEGEPLTCFISITFPVNQIFDSTPFYLGIYNVVDLIFFIPINELRCRRWRSLLGREGRRLVWGQVDLIDSGVESSPSGGKLQFIC